MPIRLLQYTKYKYHLRSIKDAEVKILRELNHLPLISLRYNSCLKIWIIFDDTVGNIISTTNTIIPCFPRLIGNYCSKCGSHNSYNNKYCKHCTSELNHGDNYYEAVKLRNDTPCLTLQQIGDKLGITRERVRQILLNQGKDTKHYIHKNIYECLECGTTIMGNSHYFCSNTCRNKYKNIPLICEQCGILFYRTEAQLLHSIKRGQKHIYCSRKCFGHVIGISNRRQ